MGLSRVHRVAVTIPSGQTVSNVVEAWNSYGGAAGIVMYSPATLPETVNVQVSPGFNTGDTPYWAVLQDGSTPADVTVPAAGKALFFDRLVLTGAFRLVATSAVGGNRVFFVSFMSIYS